MIPPLHIIEKAVRANFILDQDGKFLQTRRDRESHSKSIGRMVFIAVAQELGHSKGDICMCVGIGEAEYELKLANHKILFELGRQAFEKKAGKPLDYNKKDVRNYELRVYRKTLLVKSYCQFHS